MLVAARDEAELIAETVGALRGALPGAAVWVADDGSRDGTAAAAARAGAIVLPAGGRIGKGGAMTLLARRALGALDASSGPDPVFLLCDGDLAGSAAALPALVEAVLRDEADVAVAVFATRRGGGVGAAVGFARWALRDLTGAGARAPISGQRAMRARTLRRVLPFARGYGMELAMSIDAARAGMRILELELDLSHRVTGRSPGGFAHRARQLADFVRVYLRRR